MSLIPGRKLKEFVKIFRHVVSRRSYINYITYPAHAMDICESASLACYRSDGAEVALLVQGPLVEDNDFTLETLRGYRKQFPQSRIIFSTWPDARKVESPLRSLEIDLVVSEKPAVSGPSNFNLQLLSTQAGLHRAQMMNAKYALKTRSDQRINHPSALTYLLNLLKNYPLKFAKDSGLKGRLIGISRDTFKHRIFGLSDMFMFGYTDDLVRYWSVEQRTESKGGAQAPKVLTWRDQYAQQVTETFLMLRFLERVGYSFEPTLFATLDAYRRYFLIVNHASLELYWHKYTHDDDWHPDFKLKHYELGFHDWLLLYHSFDELQIDEQVLEQPISDCRLRI